MSEESVRLQKLVPYAAVKAMTGLAVPDLTQLLEHHGIKLKPQALKPDEFLELLAAHEHVIEPEAFQHVLNSIQEGRTYLALPKEVSHAGATFTLAEITKKLQTPQQTTPKQAFPRGVQPIPQDRLEAASARKPSPIIRQKKSRQAQTPGQTLENKDCYPPFDFYPRTGLSYEDVLKALKYTGLYSTHTKEIEHEGRKIRLIKKTVRYKGQPLTLQEFMDSLKKP